MYAKLFTSMWDGSLYGHLEASAVLMACVTLCNAQGVLDMTPEAIAGRTGWPLDFIKKGLAELEKPDARSRTPDDDGRRLALLDDHRDWGWLIVNYEKYRGLSDPDVVRSQTRERVRKHREKRNGTKRDVTLGNAQKRQAEAEAEAEAIKDTPATREPKRKVPLPDDFTLTPQRREAALKRYADADVDAMFEQFRAHHLAHGSLMKSWDAAWTTWLGNAARFGYPKLSSHAGWE